MTENKTFKEMMDAKMSKNNEGRGVVVGIGPDYGRYVSIGDGKKWVGIQAPHNAMSGDSMKKMGVNTKADPNGGAKSINTKNVLEQDKVNDASGVEDASSTHIEESAEGEKRFKEEMAKQPPATNPGEAERNVRNVLDIMERKKGDPFKMNKSISQMISEKNGTGFFKGNNPKAPEAEENKDPIIPGKKDIPNNDPIIPGKKDMPNNDPIIPGKR